MRVSGLLYARTKWKPQQWASRFQNQNARRYRFLFIFIEAVRPVPVNKATWAALKSRFR